LGQFRCLAANAGLYLASLGVNLSGNIFHSGSCFITLFNGLGLDEFPGIFAGLRSEQKQSHGASQETRITYSKQHPSLIEDERAPPCRCADADMEIADLEYIKIGDSENSRLHPCTSRNILVQCDYA
jgi:hypothetical protein